MTNCDTQSQVQYEQKIRHIKIVHRVYGLSKDLKNYKINASYYQPSNNY